MTAKEFLEQGFYINREIEQNLLELEKLETDICRGRQTFSGTSIGINNDNNIESKITGYIDKHNALVEEINAQTDNLVSVRKGIRNRIYKISQPKYRLVLLKRYILFKKWEQVQAELGYKEDKSVRRLHDKALSEFIKIHGNYFQNDLE